MIIERFVIIQAPSYNIKKSKSIIICNNSPNELLLLLKNNKGNGPWPLEIISINFDNVKIVLAF